MRTDNIGERARVLLWYNICTIFTPKNDQGKENNEIHIHRLLYIYFLLYFELIKTHFEVNNQDKTYKLDSVLCVVVYPLQSIYFFCFFWRSMVLCCSVCSFFFVFLLCIFWWLSLRTIVGCCLCEGNVQT